MRFPWLASIILKLRPKRPPDFIIGEPYSYMHRWYIIPRNKWFNIYLHEYWGDDSDEVTHDHPWKSWSLCLQGYLREEIGTVGPKATRFIGPGDFVYRNETFAHRLSLVENQETQPVTLFITGRAVREWGFHCPKGWKHWKEFTDFYKTGHSGSRGGGCGEVK